MGVVPVTVTAGEIVDLDTTSIYIPVGNNVSVNLGNVDVTFSEVTSPGFMSIITTTHPQGGQLPSQYRFLGTYYELTTTATYSGLITISFTYDDADVHGQESNLKLFHWDATSWVNITTNVDTINNLITGETLTLSPFAIGEPLIANEPPSVGTISISSNPVQINNSISLSASFTDSGVLDTHTSSWDWGDGNTSVGTVTESNGSGSVSDSHVYSQAGVYTVTLEVTDNNGGNESSQYQYVVVYDPNGGYVTGAGTINSPVGAYVADVSLSGVAHFGFNSKYAHGANVPIGKTKFRFQAADFKFESTSYDWLVVAGAKAQYKGIGTINNSGNYGFMLSAIDGAINGDGSDKFRIKIWDNNNNDAVVYDNQLGEQDGIDPTTVVNVGSSVVVHR